LRQPPAVGGEAPLAARIAHGAAGFMEDVGGGRVEGGLGQRLP
jgi:hypothetical protein